MRAPHLRLTRFPSRPSIPSTAQADHPLMRLTFPNYLFPSFLLRHKSPDTDERRSTTKKQSRDEKIQAEGKTSFAYLSCGGCHAPLTSSTIISKAFAGRYGRGYLCRDVVNVDLGRLQERYLLTGLHTVRDMNCSFCHISLGWKYCTAKEPSQRYKMGKFLLEAKNVVKLNHWPDISDAGKERKTEFEESKWETRSIDLATLTDEESRPSTPMVGKQVQGNMFYDDIEDLMLGWRDGNQRTR